MPLIWTGRGRPSSPSIGLIGWRWPGRAVGLFLLARLVVGVGAVWHITARSDDFSGSIQGLRLGWKRQVRVKKSNAVTVPMVWGVFHPTILLPADASTWQEERLRAVLLHELAHIQRNDWESQLIAQVMCAVYWFNPLVWFAARRMRVEAERASDDHVLNAGYQSTNYAEHLLDNARNVKAVVSVSRTAVAIARSSRIEERIRTTLAENLNRRPLTKLAVVVGCCIMTFFAVQMGAMRVAEAELSLEAVLEGLQSAQTEVSSGELEIIYKRDTVARISQAEARGKSQAAIHEMDERFS